MKNKFKWLFVIFIALTFNFSYMVSGDSTALARGVAFVVEVDGTAAASAASTGAASAMLAAGSGKTGLEDLEGLGEGGGEFGHYEFKPGVDLDLRGTGIEFQDALDMAFSETGVPRSEFEITQWARDKYGKSIPVEWEGPGGAKVNVDLGHSLDGGAPTEPHIGWQKSGKSKTGGRTRGHIFLDDVPANRI